MLETGTSSIRIHMPCQFHTDSQPDLYNFSRGIEEATTIYEVNAGERQLESPIPTPVNQMIEFADAPADAEENILITPRTQISARRRGSAPQTRRERLEQRQERRANARTQHESGQSQTNAYPDRIARNAASATSAGAPKASPRRGSGESEKDCCIQ